MFWFSRYFSGVFDFSCLFLSVLVLWASRDSFFGVFVFSCFLCWCLVVDSSFSLFVWCVCFLMMLSGGVVFS